MLLPAPVGMSEKNIVVISKVVLVVGFQTPWGARAHGGVVGFIRDKGDVLRIFLHYWVFQK